jgi:hypothetical protein
VNSQWTEPRQSYLTTDGQSASLSWCQVPIWDPVTILSFFPLPLDSCRFLDVGRRLWRVERVCSLQLLLGLASASSSGLSPVELMTIRILLSQIWDSPTWSSRFPYLVSPETGYPSYTTRHWVELNQQIFYIYTCNLCACIAETASSVLPLLEASSRIDSWSSFSNVVTGCTENFSSVSECSPVAKETICPRSCSPARAVPLQPVYTTIIWHWVYLSQYSHDLGVLWLN